MVNKYCLGTCWSRREISRNNVTLSSSLLSRQCARMCIAPVVKSVSRYNDVKHCWLIADRTASFLYEESSEHVCWRESLIPQPLRTYRRTDQVGALHNTIANPRKPATGSGHFVRRFRETRV